MMNTRIISHYSKVTRISFYFIIALFLTPSFFAAGKKVYTDKDTAIRLALHLDKGSYKGLKISSTFVLDDPEGFYVAVTLSNGKTRRWYMNTIYDAVKRDQLTLRDNRSLIFNPKNLSTFDIFRKNEFHRNALQATIYNSFFPRGDRMEEISLLYQIKEFFLLPPASTKKQRRGPDGFPYKYRLELINGEKKYFTIPQAYELQKRQQLIAVANDSLKALGKPYKVVALERHEKKLDRQGINEFSIEVVFDMKSHQDEQLLLNAKDFPVNIYEKTFYQKNGSPYTKFLIDVTLPNIIFDISPSARTFKSFEYLENVKLIKAEKPSRSTLRATLNTLNYRFIEIPPVVSLNSHNTKSDSIYITFFHSYDQSINAGKIAEKLNRREEERLQEQQNNKALIIEQTDGGTPFGKAYKAALAYYNTQESFKGQGDKKIENLKIALEFFESSAMLATTDDEFRKAIEQRNNVRTDIYNQVIKQTEEGLLYLRNENIEVLLERLKEAEKYTNTDFQLVAIEKLNQVINTENKIKIIRSDISEFEKTGGSKTQWEKIQMDLRQLKRGRLIERHLTSIASLQARINKKMIP